MDRSPSQPSRLDPIISNTVTTEQIDEIEPEIPVLRLRLQKPKKNRKVSWTSETVDNEELGKKKSKCCCVYTKPLKFGESSSEEEDDCEHCTSHVEKRTQQKENKIDDVSNDKKCHDIPNPDYLSINEDGKSSSG